MRAALLALAATAFTWFLLRAESQQAIALLVLLAVVAGVLAARLRPREKAAPGKTMSAATVPARR